MNASPLTPGSGPGGGEENWVHEPADPVVSRILSGSITATLMQASRILGGDPLLLRSAVRHLSCQQDAARRREKAGEDGVPVPAVLMFSLTGRCNLTCTGCYHRAQYRKPAPEMTCDQIASLVSQCSDLGISIIVLAGGEPLVRWQDILPVIHENPDILFAIYTNGILIDENLADVISRTDNLVPVISVEGGRKETDSRRSEGIYDAVMKAFSLLKMKKVFFGCSVTITRHNFQEVTGSPFITDLINQGSRFFSFVEYVPVAEETGDLTLTDQQRHELNSLINTFSTTFPALFVAFPGDEQMFGGCLSAGRGFLHLSPSGDLEPCPAAPFSDVNITDTPLKDALRSEFLSRIRSHHGMLSESGGGCALWKNRDWVSSVLETGKRSENG